ncbi:N-6 DNA methylase [Ekhidna sp.]|uniref:N-6 DNA methylase n=1 Tax=Ekhidna sp. TaxID=2608089 RepID=UPI003B51178A
MENINELRNELLPEIKLKFENKIKSKSELLAEIKNSLFYSYYETSDIDQDQLIQFAFNSFYTKEVLNKTETNVDTLERYTQISKVVEDCYYKFPTKDNLLKTKNWLSVSKEFGTFFTPISISRVMAKKVVDDSISKIILDPCCGTGNLLAACLEYSYVNNIRLNKIIGIDIDPLSANTCQNLLKSFAKQLNLDLEIEIIVGDAVQILSKQNSLFKEHPLPETYSIIINPPYGKIKFDSDKLNNSETATNYGNQHKSKKDEYNRQLRYKIQKALNGSFKSKGNMEWSSVFLNLCISSYKQKENIVFIGPCSWLNSKTQSEIRKYVIKNRLLSYCHFISETQTKFETVNQPLAISQLKGSSNQIVIENDFNDNYILEYANLKLLSDYDYAIPRSKLSDMGLFLRIQSFEKIKSSQIQNYRGELDQSLNKSILTNEVTKLKVIRGENVGRFKELDVPQERNFYADLNEYENQIAKKPKGKHSQLERLIGRQCSYMNQRRRLVFNIFPKDIVVGNSCNYLIVPAAEKFYILGLLNSTFMDWYFRVMNGNNHVANYEIDDFPLPNCDEELKKKISKEVKSLIKKFRQLEPTVINNEKFEAYLDFLVFKAYDLSPNDIDLILSNYDSDYGVLISKFFER